MDLTLNEKRVFANESVLCIRWPKDWSFSFSISPSSEHSGLISFRTDWFDLLAVQGTLSLESSPAPQFKSINSSALSLLYGPTLTSMHDSWKDQSFGHMNLLKILVSSGICLPFLGSPPPPVCWEGVSTVFILVPTVGSGKLQAKMHHE